VQGVPQIKNQTSQPIAANHNKKKVKGNYMGISGILTTNEEMGLLSPTSQVLGKNNLTTMAPRSINQSDVTQSFAMYSENKYKGNGPSNALTNNSSILQN